MKNHQDQDNFYKHIAQTSPEPLAFFPSRAEGIYIYDQNNRPYVDLIAGICVSQLGHGNAAVLNAIQKQSSDYIFTMVYGEHIQSPQVQFAHALCEKLPQHLDNVYFVNSGSEAIEGAIKLARRTTGRFKTAALKGAYHGNTLGVLALRHDLHYTRPFRPLMPGTVLLERNNLKSLEAIDEEVACVILETIQSAPGYRVPDPEWMLAVRERCTDKGTLLVLDEIQAGLGRTGKLWGFEQYGIEPDILCLAKALGGGMPMAAFISSHQRMRSLSHDPVLGHITTFGGHPVCCAAGLAAFRQVSDKNLLEAVEDKSVLFRQLLIHKEIQFISGIGLMLAVEVGSREKLRAFIERAYEQGVLTDWFIHNDQAFRIAPPLTISMDEIRQVCSLILKALDEI